jgi:hypothetical protein
LQPATTALRTIDPLRSRLAPSTSAAPTTSTLTPATLLSRGPLAARAHRLLGLGTVGNAQRGSAETSLRSAFGGDVLTWQRVGTPWIAARSLARPTDALPSQSAVGWLLSQ